MSECDKVIVFDDFRKLFVTEDNMHGGVPCVHCETEEEFLAELDLCEGLNLNIILDHDLGMEMVDGDDMSSRNGIRKLMELHKKKFLTVTLAAVVTMNPIGRKWIVAELKQANITHFIDPGGRLVGVLST